jgi:hypothetical protein
MYSVPPVSLSRGYVYIYKLRLLKDFAFLSRTLYFLGFFTCLSNYDVISISSFYMYVYTYRVCVCVPEHLSCIGRDDLWERSCSETWLKLQCYCRILRCVGQWILRGAQRSYRGLVQVRSQNFHVKIKKSHGTSVENIGVRLPIYDRSALRHAGY